MGDQQHIKLPEMGDAQQDVQRPYWLPKGWTVEAKATDFGRIRKCYINSANGHKFYTKPEVLRYLTGEVYVPQKRKEPKKVCVKMTAAEKLPPGWIKEIRRKLKGDEMRDDVYYIDPVTGHRFKSVKAALRYLEDKGEWKVESDDNDGDHVNIERTIAEKLPTGWIKEIETRKNGKIRKETYYIDPATGLYFRSMVEVCRYLGIEDPRKVKPVADDEDFISEESEDDSQVVSVKSSAAKYLPPGWVKEIVKRKKDDKIRYMTYYIDPVTGNYFRSMPKACRYLGIEDPRKDKAAADCEDYSSSCSEAKGQRMIKYKDTDGKSKTIKSARGNKRRERTSSLHLKTSKRLAARKQVPPREAETSNESDENPTNDQTENLNQQNEPVSSLLVYTPCIEESAVVKDDEKSEKQPDPFVDNEDQLVDVTIIEGEIPLSGNNWSDPNLELTVKTPDNEMPVDCGSHLLISDAAASQGKCDEYVI